MSEFNTKIYGTENKYDELTKRKDIHVNLPVAVKHKVKIICMQHQITMQDLFNEFAFRVANENDSYIKGLIYYLRTGREPEIILDKDVDLIYQHLEMNSPFFEEDEDEETEIKYDVDL